MGLTPLLYAIECNNEKAVRVLLEYNDVNIEYKLPDDFADYPYINKYEGDSFNIGGATPLMFAIFKSNPRIVKQLIDKNADVKARDNEGTPVFLYACGFGNGNIISSCLLDFDSKAKIEFEATKQTISQYSNVNSVLLSSVSKYLLRTFTIFSLFIIMLLNSSSPVPAIILL